MAQGKHGLGGEFPDATHLLFVDLLPARSVSSGSEITFAEPVVEATIRHDQNEPPFYRSLSPWKPDGRGNAVTAEHWPEYFDGSAWRRQLPATDTPRPAA